MMRSAGLLSFGPFQLDPERRRLIRAGEPVALPDRHIDILLLLASTAGHIVSKDALSHDLTLGLWDKDGGQRLALIDGNGQLLAVDATHLWSLDVSDPQTGTNFRSF
jgi:hypothetical protein